MLCRVLTPNSSLAFKVFKILQINKAFSVFCSTQRQAPSAQGQGQAGFRAPEEKFLCLVLVFKIKACAYQLYYFVFDRNKVEAMTRSYNSPTYG